MKLKSFNCPNCGASIQIPEGKDSFFCTYCGSQIQIDDGKITIDLNANINLNQKYTDVARLKELELREKELERQELAEKKEKWQPIWWILTWICSIVVYCLCCFAAGSFDNILKKFFAIIAFIDVILVPIALLITIPKRWRSAFNRQMGCIGCCCEIIALIILVTFWFTFILIPGTVIGG